MVFATLPMSCCFLANAALNHLEAGKGCDRETYAACVRQTQQAGDIMALVAGGIWLLSLVLLIGWMRRWSTRALASIELLIVLGGAIPVLFWSR